MAKTFQIECPCCGKILEVDALTGNVLATREKRQALSLEDFMKNEAHHEESLNAMFEAAREKEQHRFENLEKKFEETKKRKDLKDPPPSIFWD